MDIYVLDTKLNDVGVIDMYSSIIWAQRYDKAGDFELYLPASDTSLALLQKGFYLTRDDTDSVMLIKNINIKTDVEQGAYLIVTGKTLETLLSRRIVWNQTLLNGKAEKCIRRLLTENIISPLIPERKIKNFAIGSIKGWSEEISLQVTGDKLSDVISSICRQFGWGYKITIVDKAFVFELYKGEDNGVTFSSDFDNLITSDYCFNSDNFSNVALVAGEGEGVNRRTQTVGTAEGIDRIECFVDARNVSSNDESISAEKYNSLLRQSGTDVLREKQNIIGFNSEVAPNMIYKYKKDYVLGDICHVVNDYGIEVEARITEIIESESETGYSVLPTFEEWSVKT